MEIVFNVILWLGLGVLIFFCIRRLVNIYKEKKQEGKKDTPNQDKENLNE